MINQIYLIGPMGSGKSTMGRLLAKKLGLPYFDLDKLIEDQEKMSISDIFQKHNEKYFRDLESITLKQYSEESNFVISTGGGCVLRDQNLNILRKGLVIYLKISIEIQFERVKNRTHRPLLNNVTKDTLAQLDKERGSVYSGISNIEVDVSNLDKEDVLSTIIRRLESYSEKN